MIYLADQWPEAYRGKLFTLNFHGRRVNVERLERSGSGYVGRHEPDIDLRRRPLVPRHRPELWPRRRRLRPRLERHRRMPRPRRRPPDLGANLQVHLWSDSPTSAYPPGSSRRPGPRGAAPAQERVVRPPGQARPRRSGGRRQVDGRGRHSARSDRRRGARSGPQAAGDLDDECARKDRQRLSARALARPARSDPGLGDPVVDRRHAAGHDLQSAD